jgi:hypothetical protein
MRRGTKALLLLTALALVVVAAGPTVQAQAPKTFVLKFNHVLGPN